MLRRIRRRAPAVSRRTWISLSDSTFTSAGTNAAQLLSPRPRLLATAARTVPSPSSNATQMFLVSRPGDAKYAVRTRAAATAFLVLESGS